LLIYLHVTLARYLSADQPFRTDGTTNIKSLPVIELLDNPTTLFVTKPQAYLPPVMTMAVLTDKSQKKEMIQQDNSAQKTPQPGCMMPPQPEAYIKCPRFDFL
jgi:hypothetical protein